MNHFV